MDFSLKIYGNSFENVEKKKQTMTSSGTNADSCVCNFKGALNFPESSTEPFRNYYRLCLRTCNLSSKEGSICDESPQERPQ